MRKISTILKLKYADFLKNDGFTLVEMLFTFSIFIIIITFITPIFQVLQSGDDLHLQNRIEVMEWDVFCSQMKKEIRMCTKVQVTNNTLVLTEDEGTVVYEQYKNSLRRRVNNAGHEILLQNVSEVHFTLQKNAIKVSVKDLYGKDYALAVYSLLDWNDAL